MSGVLSLLPVYAFMAWTGKSYLSNSLLPSGVKTQSDFCRRISRKEIRLIRWAILLFFQALGFSR